jgi:hypothetical protein
MVHMWGIVTAKPVMTIQYYFVFRDVVKPTLTPLRISAYAGWMLAADAYSLSSSTACIHFNCASSNNEAAGQSNALIGKYVADDAAGTTFSDAEHGHEVTYDRPYINTQFMDAQYGAQLAVKWAVDGYKP